jgi:hypothetical protein
MKKFLSVTLVMMMLFSFASIGSFADDGCTTYPYITMDDSNDFTCVMDLSDRESMKVVGLSSSYVKTDFTDAEKAYLTWTTSDSSIAKFQVGALQFNSLSGVDNGIVVATGEGRATITITYAAPDDDPVSVTSVIVVEGSTTDFTELGLTVPLFELTDIYGISFDDDEVMKKQPTVMHGLLYALECYHDSDGTTDINDASWDWDWVSNNVVIYTQGSYVNAIGTDINSSTDGWQYEVNSTTINYAASIEPLSANDDLDWAYEEYSW